MPDPTGGGFLGVEKIVEYLWAGIAAAFAWGWKHTHRRVDTLRIDLNRLRDTKAEKSEIDRQRAHVEKIYDRLDDQARSLAAIDAKLEIVCKHYGRKD